MHTDKQPIYFVSLGPGDPDLITLKGLKILQEADVIYCPATQDTEGKTSSRSADIVAALGIPPEKTVKFILPMQRNREAALQAYDNLVEAASRLHAGNRRIAVVAEGDAGFYTSIQYLYDKLTARQIEVIRIAGVPAFIAAGAMAGMHIVKQNEKLVVMPGITSVEELTDKIKEGYAVVIMKLSSCREKVKECIRLFPEASWNYFENIGNENEYHTTDTETILQKQFPYFSLMVITASRKED